MDTHASLLVYKELAECYEQKGEPSMRDRFLVLAADAALASGMPEEAERLRQWLLQVNPHHLLRPYGSFAQALQAPDVQIYVRDLRLNYPLDTAESLLRTLRDEGQMLPPQEAGAAGNDTMGTLRPGYQVRDEPAPKPLRQPTRSGTLPRTSSRSSIPLPAPAAPASAPVTRPAQPAASVPAAKPGARPATTPRQAAPPAAAPKPTLTPRPSRPKPVPAEAPSGSWMSSFLFGVFLLAAIALAVFALARPWLELRL